MNRAPGMFQQPTKAGEMQWDRVETASAWRVVHNRFAGDPIWMQGDHAYLFLKQRYKVLGHVKGPFDAVHKTTDKAYAIEINDRVV